MLRSSTIIPKWSNLTKNLCLNWLINFFHKNSEVLLPAHDNAYNLATRFNNFFIQKIVNIRSDLQAVSVNLPSLNSLPSLTETTVMSHPSPPVLSDFEPTTVAELLKIIRTSKATTCDLDPFPTKLLKECLDVLLPVILKIVNLSLSSGIMPSALKKALVLPLLKKINMILEIFKNYRPVSNLPYLSKIIERVVAKRVITHMDINNLYELLQSAYRAFHSCETALIRVQNDILRAVDRGQCVLLVLLDLSAAFDTVDHVKMLQILSDRLGVTGAALEWFRSYLSYRKQAVTIEGVESDVWDILFGVPQGSVLGPLLFTIYLMPLGDIIRKHNIMFHCYADDTQLYISFNTTSSNDALTKMEQCINDIRLWMASNFLKLNDDKTEVMLIGTPSMLNKIPSQTLRVGNDDITPTDTARNIGALFDMNLSMSRHVSQICKGAWNQLRQIGQIRKYLDSSSTATLMHSFISSRLDNFNSLLCGLPKNQITKLQRVQNAAVRMVTRHCKHDHITPILKNLHWLPVEKRITYKILLVTYKALNGQAPMYIRQLLSIRSSTRTLRSNSQILLNVPKCRLSTYGCRAFSFTAPFLWNNLPDNVRCASSIESFISLVKTLLFKEAYDC